MDKTANKYGALNQDLHNYVHAGSLPEVKDALSKGADINSTTGLYGWTPLIRAVKRGHIKVARFLIQQRADPYILDSSSHTAMDYCGENKEMALLIYSYALPTSAHLQKVKSDLEKMKRRDNIESIIDDLESDIKKS